MSKTIDNILDEYAVKHGYSDWTKMFYGEGIEIGTKGIEEIAERYAQSKTETIKHLAGVNSELKKKTQELQQQNAELVELVERCKDVIYAYNDYRPTATGNEILQAIQDRLTKYNHLK